MTSPPQGRRQGRIQYLERRLCHGVWGWKSPTGVQGKAPIIRGLWDKSPRSWWQSANTTMQSGRKQNRLLFASTCGYSDSVFTFPAYLFTYRYLLTRLYFLTFRFRATDLKFESMRFNRNNLENWQRLNQLFWSLFEDGTRIDVPSSAFQVQTVCETTFQNINNSCQNTTITILLPRPLCCRATRHTVSS